jgi:hypothetical protein
MTPAVSYVITTVSFYVFLIDEGPRSRRYGRTAALRLLVQPCDEDEDGCYFVLSIS